MNSRDPIDRLLASGLIDGGRRPRIGLLANQISYSRSRGRYLFQILAEQSERLRVFLPEHGLFAELQDQIPIGDSNLYSEFAGSKLVDWVSLYGKTEGTLKPDLSRLSDLDVLIIDLQDVGARYYTFLTTAWYAMETAVRAGLALRFVLVDRPNPAGRTVEGTPLLSRYASFVGVPGVPHRHGLTAGELLYLYSQRLKKEAGLDVPLAVVPFDASSPPSTWEICPSPNMPSPLTPFVYAGQCLLEGTNVSEGRGTTRPFEIFGAPWIRLSRPLPAHLLELLERSGAQMRPLRFLPTFHKHAGTACNGWQLHVAGSGLHSLLYSLDLIRYLRETYSEFAWRESVYEYRSDLSAIEMLAGDPAILGYLNGQLERSALIECLRDAERSWIEQTRPYLLYGEDLRSSVPG